MPHSNDPLDRFYAMLHRLELSVRGKRVLGDCTSRSCWPRRGVYFFFHQKEQRIADPATLRVVRVGTHAVSAGSKSTLWKRLDQHRGVRTGGGNHRGSIFRLHCGMAMLNAGMVDPPITTWGRDQSPTPEIRKSEVEMEMRVSRYLREHRVLWVRIDDEPAKTSRRSFVERNAIALLSNRLSPTDASSPQWLGRSSVEERIRKSGLWNLQHIDAELDVKFLDEFDRVVDETIAWHRDQAPKC
jgi:hypothetical protein